MMLSADKHISLSAEIIFVAIPPNEQKIQEQGRNDDENDRSKKDREIGMWLV